MATVKFSIGNSAHPIRTLTTRPQQQPASYFRFLDLSAEIRNMIYEELVVVGEVHYNDKSRFAVDAQDSYVGRQKPDLTLFRVCNQIYFEAESLYLRKNTFSLPGNFHLYSPFSRLEDIAMLNKDSWLFSGRGLALVKNIRVNFASEYITYDNADLWLDYDIENGEGAMQKLSVYDRTEIVHEWKEDIAIQYYFLQHCALSLLSPRMERVELDFTRSFCDMGCCRVFDMCLGDWIEHLNPKALRITGLMRGEEKDIQYDYIKTDGEAVNYNFEDLERLYGLRINMY
ncbi:hypothetical protein ACN47E_002240 [Coniothyrium glycines]